MIPVRGLTKEYGDVRAVDGLAFDVEPGKVTGSLGPADARVTLLPGRSSLWASADGASCERTRTNTSPFSGAGECRRSTAERFSMHVSRTRVLDLGARRWVALVRVFDGRSIAKVHAVSESG